MFYKIGFYVLLVILAAFVWLFVNSNPMMNEGASSWIDLYSDNPKATIGFLDRNFGIKVASIDKSGIGTDYHVVKAKGQLWPFAGIMETPIGPDGKKIMPSTMIYLTVKDYAAMDAKIVADGAIPLMQNNKAKGMIFGIYKIPGGFEIAIVQYGKAK
ncbi:MAG: hypothetical protein LBU68_01480 [Rickettsiales bacterium]|jgi:predicted enzyme related to lactoylglutathione lyase|nr:hypothetical protein [Rickettsiales bacterium]